MPQLGIGKLLTVGNLHFTGEGRGAGEGLAGGFEEGEVDAAVGALLDEAGVVGE